MVPDKFSIQFVWKSGESESDSGGLPKSVIVDVNSRIPELGTLASECELILGHGQWPKRGSQVALHATPN